ncbi:aromatic-ring-hydroxylating dioxygenase subunit beta [Pseudomonas sp. GCM10022188]|uniref:aromatic-ring-hydroxylating dioxygenase subunit beta n=1 Tax=Pseudomonas TaxID=286 RepID=UPI001E2B59D4|nr:aromatic-ring-hydroxylating dioxygenase subunit beta [Pseudomonas oryzagri]MCC6076726.1 hypothetical protein [Pseudomonas oryzagri]
MKSNTQLLAQVTEFIGYEADLLDHKGYKEWLSLWTDSGLYIVPADLNETDYLNALNLALDDAEMRNLRVARLQNGESVSAMSVGNTVRMMSRVRILEAGEEAVMARCAMTLNELRHGKLVSYPANVEYILRPTSEGFKMEQKVVKLLHADGFLRTVSFIF